MTDLKTIALAATVIAASALISMMAPRQLLAQAVRAALVRDIDHPARQPVRVFGFFSLTSLDEVNALSICPLSGACTTTAVPAGKRLVLESMSIKLTMPPGQVFNTITVNNYQLAVSLEQTIGGSNIYAGSHMLRIYSDDTVVLNIYRPGASSSANVAAFGFGYLVDLN